jgi:hypothetical protein
LFPVLSKIYALTGGEGGSGRLNLVKLHSTASFLSEIKSEEKPEKFVGRREAEAYKAAITHPLSLKCNWTN